MAFTSITVVGHPSVLNFRRIQRPSRVQLGSSFSRRFITSSSEITGSFFFFSIVRSSLKRFPRSLRRAGVFLLLSAGNSREERLDQGLGLHQRFFVLCLGIRVGHDAAANLKVGPAPSTNDGADGDVQVQVSAKVQIADRAGVNPPPGRLELLNDFHRPNFWRPGHRSPRKTGPQQVDTVAVPPQSAQDAGGGLEDRGVGLEGPEGPHPDRTVLADPAQVVPLEIYDHDELRLVFRTPQQFLSQIPIVSRALAAGAGPLHGARLHPAIAESEESLGRSPDDSDLAVVEEAAERRRIDSMEAPIEGEGVLVEAGGEPLRKIDLIDVSGGDVLLGLADRVQIPFLREGALEAAPRAFPLCR